MKNFFCDRCEDTGVIGIFRKRPCPKCGGAGAQRMKDAAKNYIKEINSGAKKDVSNNKRRTWSNVL